MATAKPCKACGELVEYQPTYHAQGIRYEEGDYFSKGHLHHYKAFMTWRCPNCGYWYKTSAPEIE